MPKFADIFEEMNVPYRCTILSIKPNVQGQFGPQNVVTVEHGGAQFDWWVKPATFDRLFLNDGQQFVFEGDAVDIVQNPPQGKTKFPFYTLEKVGAGSASPAKRPTPPPAHPQTPSNAPRVNSEVASQQNQFQEERERKEDLKQRIISIAGFTQALITKGMPVEEAKLAGATLAVWCKNQAIAWQTEEQTNQMFGEQE